LILTTRKRPSFGAWLFDLKGIFKFGLLLLEAMPVLVEAGVLLDLFTAVLSWGSSTTSTSL
jgi:hydrogenase-4 membrane subunit HyfE